MQKYKKKINHKKQSYLPAIIIEVSLLKCNFAFDFYYMTRNYKLFNNLIGWLLIFPLATFTYLSTIEPTASFWDCGEYIACSHKLEVGHPPGAPFFLLLGRLFILFGGDDPSTAAKWVNVMSALSSSFTILFLYWSLTRLSVKIINGLKREFTPGRMIGVFSAGIIGSLAYTFSDSFWFSAVEGEVYAMSSLFTAVAFWAILKWEEEADQPSSVRWLIFIAYLVGLSIGVHLLNLLVIPAICFIYYFRKYPFNIKGILICGVISVIILGGIQGVLIPNVVKFSADYELFFVNSLGMSFNTGTTIYFILLVASLILGILYSVKRTGFLFNTFIASASIFAILTLIAGKMSTTNTGMSIFLRLIGFGLLLWGLVHLKKNPVALHHILVSIVVLLLGYSTFFVLVIRSQANTPMDENNPENAISLLSYLNREQYGDWPILRGNYFNAELDQDEPYLDGTPIYGKDTTTGKYVVVDDRKQSIPNYDKRYVTFFPRMWSTQGGHAAFYESWSGFIPGQTDGAGNEIIKPSFAQNLRYFFKYQVGYMYLRYFGWNFIGRQNDIQGLINNNTEGNVITGFGFLDKVITGVDQNKMPYATKNNKGTNKLYMLPLLLGLLGMFWHAYAHKKDFIVTLLLFFFTGLAIVVYLNQYPYQPRERDYAYAASFYAFAIWIGIGALAITDILYSLLVGGTKSNVKSSSANTAAQNDNPYSFLTVSAEQDSGKNKTGVVVAVSILLITSFVPYLMAREGWDDHDRSKRTMARDFAINYLQSCEKNAVLFTNGDNDTFPLWYVQEVEGIRTDVRVINLSLLQTDWYINQMRRAAYDSPPVPFTMDPKKYEGSKREVVYVFPDKNLGYQNVKKVIDLVSSDDPKDKNYYNGRYLDYIPTKKFRIPVYGNINTGNRFKDSIQNRLDSIKIVSNKSLVPNGYEKRVVKNVDWEISKSYITKNDLMVLDLLAGFKWERPIYFAVTTGPESYLNLQDYFQLEGLAYRLVPIKSNREEMVHQTRVYSKKMYDNIMNTDKSKWAWGGMDDTTGTGTNLDENCMRMALNMRIQMTTLASVLIQEGQREKASKVLDKMMQVMPEKNVPYDATMYTAAICYYKLASEEQRKGNSKGKEEALSKANALAKRVFDIFESDFFFYVGLSSDDQISYQREIKQCSDIMGGLREFLTSYSMMERDPKSKTEVSGIASDFKRRYETIFGVESVEPPQTPNKELKPLNDSNR